jgi:integrase
MRTQTMKAIKLTDREIKKLAVPKSGKKFYRDGEMRRFGVRVYASGARSFAIRYYPRGSRCEGFYTIGPFPDWNPTAAREEAKRLLQIVDTGGDPQGDIQAKREAPTVSELCDRFIAEYMPRKKPTTQATYRRLIETIIRPELGRLKVAEVSFENADALHRKVTARGTRGKRAPYHANRAHAVGKRMFSMAIKWKYRGDNPFKGVELNDEHKRKRYLSNKSPDDELSRLLAALAAYPEQQSADIIRMLMLTGARRGEVLAARWEDFDLTAGTWTKPAATTKTRTEHQVPLSAAARALLEQLRRRTNSEWLFPAGDSHRKDVRDAWLAICRKANIEGVRLHDLRHTYASVLASTGESLPIIGALLGHTVPTTTARYTHFFDDPLRAATERAGKILSGR